MAFKALARAASGGAVSSLENVLTRVPFFSYEKV